MFNTTPTVTPTPVFRLKDLGFKTVALLFPVVSLYILVSDGDGCGDTPLDFRFFPIAGGAAILLAFTWSFADKQRYPYTRLRYLLTIFLRFFLAYKIMEYGVAKVMDAQFTPYMASLDTKVADMVPQSLAWAFFGHSYAYECFIGWSQIAAVLLLFFRKTYILGALLLAVIMINVVFVNFAFDVCVKFFSCSYLVMAIYLLLEDAPRLTNVLLLNRPTEKRVYPELLQRTVHKRIAVITGILLGIFVVVYPTNYIYKSMIKYGIGKHTVFYGAWAVDSLHHSRDSLNRVLNTDSSGWKRLLFEDAGEARTKSWKQRMGIFHYDTDPVKHTLHMKRSNPDSLLVVDAVYRLDGDTLYLNGKYGADSLYIRGHRLRKYLLRNGDLPVK